MMTQLTALTSRTRAPMVRTQGRRWTGRIPQRLPFIPTQVTLLRPQVCRRRWAETYQLEEEDLFIETVILSMGTKSHETAPSTTSLQATSIVDRSSDNGECAAEVGASKYADGATG